MMVHPDQANPKYKYSWTKFRSCVKLTIGLDGINDRIDTKMMKNPDNLQGHLEYLDYDRKTYIGTLKK